MRKLLINLFGSDPETPAVAVKTVSEAEIEAYSRSAMGQARMCKNCGDKYVGIRHNSGDVNYCTECSWWLCDHCVGLGISVCSHCRLHQVDSRLEPYIHAAKGDVHRAALGYLYDILHDYDGYESAEGLKRLIDETVLFIRDTLDKYEANNG